MPVYKGTLLFNYTGSPSVGFSESLEFSALSDSAARTIIASWPTLRRGWLASQWKIVGFRLAKVTFATISGPPVKCVKRYEPIEIGACVTQPTGQLGDAGTPWDGVLFRITFADPAKKPRHFIARGIPDSWWSAGALSIPAGDGNKFLTWFNGMKSNGAVGFTADPLTGCTTATTKWNQYCSVRMASRRIGRPFGLIRGRRSSPPA